MQDIYNGRVNNLRSSPTTPTNFMENILLRSTDFFSKPVIDCFESLEKGAMASRNVLEVIVKTYSPVAFTKNEAFNKRVNGFFGDGGREYLEFYFDKYVKGSSSRITVMVLIP